MVIIWWFQDKFYLLLKQRIIYHRTKMLDNNYTPSLGLYVVVWITCYVFAVFGALPLVTSEIKADYPPDLAIRDKFGE